MLHILTQSTAYQAKEVPAEHRAAQWAEEFDGQPGDSWAAQLGSSQQQQYRPGGQPGAAEFEAGQQQRQHPSEQSWASEFTQQAGAPPASAAPAAREAAPAEADAMAAAAQQVIC